MNHETYLGETAFQAVDDRDRLGVADRNVLWANPHQGPMLSMQADRCVVRIALPNVVKPPEPRVGGDCWSRDLGKAGLESICEQAENHHCRDKIEDICPEEGSDGVLCHDVLRKRGQWGLEEKASWTQR